MNRNVNKNMINVFNYSLAFSEKESESERERMSSGSSREKCHITVELVFD